MNLEKIGLLLLLNYFNQLGTVKNHLLLALKQVLLAIQASLEIVTHSPPNSILGGNKEMIHLLFTPVQKVLNYAIERVTPQDGVEEVAESEGQFLKEHIVSSIVSVIDDEIENTRETTSEKGKLKIEALNTVKKVLLTQTKNIPPTPSEEKDSPRNLNAA